MAWVYLALLFLLWSSEPACPSCLSHGTSLCFMVLVYSCMITLDSWRKLLLYLFLSLWFFPWAFEGGVNQQALGVDKKAVREGVGPWKIQSRCCLRWEAKGRIKWPFGRRGSFHSCDFLSLWLQDPSRAARALGGVWEHVEVREEEQRIDLGGGEQVSEPQGRGTCYLYVQWWKRVKKHPPHSPSLLISKYSKGLWVCTVASQMFFKVYNWPDL